MFTVGPFQENCYLVRADGAEQALLIDPGDEAPKLQSAMDELGVTPEAILLTHTHIDHIGAVAAIATATGAPVYCPRNELAVLADPGRFFPPEWGTVDPWEAEQPLDGGERLQLAGFDIEVVPPPATARATSRTSIEGGCSPATCSSRARSAAPTCPAATTPRSWRRSPRCSSASTTTRRSTPVTWA